MASKLTLMSIKARKVIKYGMYFVVFVMIGRGLWFGAIGIYRNFIPEKLDPPTMGFGPMPPIEFPEQQVELPDLTYTVETPGDLPTFPEQMKVYFMVKPSANLFSLESATSKAQALGYDSEPIKLSPSLYRFNSLSSPSSMEINIVNSTFSTSYNLAADSSPLLLTPPDAETAIEEANDLLKTASSLPEDLTGETTHEFLKVEGQNLVKALSLSDANLIRVNLYRKMYGFDINEEGDEVGGYPSMTARPTEGNVWFILSGARQSEKQLIASEFHHFSVKVDQPETYPIKTAKVALEELRAGNGYVADLGLNLEGNITIRRIYLGYYDPDEPLEFFQPIVVFEGDGGFYAYVPAVSPVTPE